MMIEIHSGNGASSPAEGQSREPRSAGEHGRQIRQGAEALAAAVRDATNGAQGYLTAQVAQRPFRILGVAAGVGYVLGGGLSSRLTATLLGAAARVATAFVARELGARILQSGFAAPHDMAEKVGSIGEPLRAQAPQPGTSTNGPSA